MPILYRRPRRTVNGLQDTDVSDLLEAQTLRQQAHDRLTDAMAQYRIKTVYYLQVTGR